MSSIIFLGLEKDSSLTWREHGSRLLPKFREAFYALLTISYTIDVHTLKHMYYACFHSHNGVIFWGNSSGSSNVFVMQVKVLRLITKLASNESWRVHSKDLKILPLPLLYTFNCIVFVFFDFEIFYSKNRPLSHFTRISLVLQYPSPYLFFEASFYDYITLFVSLPNHNKSVQSRTFRMSLLQYLTLNCFLSVQVYIRVLGFGIGAGNVVRPEGLFC